MLDQLQDLETRRADGIVNLPGDERLEVSNLHKVFWPEGSLTKGDLMRYYVQVSPLLLPVVADRPLVMKRFPNGIAAKAFYQQRAPDTCPTACAWRSVEGDEDVPSRLIGGSLKTLLYMTQLAAISQDPWFSRVQSPAMPTTWQSTSTRCRVRRSRACSTSRAGYATSSQRSASPAYPKTSGRRRPAHLHSAAAGHAVRSRPHLLSDRRDDGRTKHPKVATVERAVRARGPRMVYVDYLQNIQGKTLAIAYSARASDLPARPRR